jgi:hypothetical protein
VGNFGDWRQRLQALQIVWLDLQFVCYVVIVFLNVVLLGVALKVLVAELTFFTVEDPLVLVLVLVLVQ